MTAWTIYLLSTAVMVVVLYFASRHWPMRWLRVLFLLLLSLLLITPVGVTGSEALAPAWLVVVFEYLFGSAQQAIDAARPIAMAFALFAIIVTAILLLATRHKKRNQ